eukprot:XP_011407442.1 PREDICTED: uncharacterized protein LOC105314773 [Amphimedon queenslandica]
MGILNLTPDSFSDGGRFEKPDIALRHALAMIEAGAEIIDVGGESTRPGAHSVGVAEEIDRVLPLIEALACESDAPISIDTSKPDVMRAAVAAGASMINDVRALGVPGAVDAAADLGVPVCLMHLQGEPGTMQDAPHYDDVVGEVQAFLLERARVCEDRGLPKDRIVIDPGFGFGKTLDHNLALLGALERLAGNGYPVLVGMSRKSMVQGIFERMRGFGQSAKTNPANPARGSGSLSLTNSSAASFADRRMVGSVALAMIAAQRKAAAVRVHDVAETCAAIDILACIEGFEADGSEHPEQSLDSPDKGSPDKGSPDKGFPDKKLAG